MVDSLEEERNSYSRGRERKGGQMARTMATEASRGSIKAS
jgi:hypothetical protein